MPNVTTSRKATLCAIALAVSFFLGAFGLAPPSAGATSAKASTGAASWAYGATRSASITTPTTNGSATISIAFGYQVVMAQTTPNASTVSVQATRTAVESFQVRGCAPACGLTARSAVNISARSLEVDTVFANFTRSAAVELNGSAVPALGLEDTHALMRANLTENWSATIHSTLVGLRSPRAAIRVGASTEEATVFHPALGIVPLSVSPGSRWSSSSTASAAGAWSVAYAFTNTSGSGSSTNQSAAPHGSASGSQVVSLTGGDAGLVSLTGGIVTHAIDLNVTGTFHTREGFIFLPSQADLFGESHGAWEPLEAGQAAASTSAVDYAPASAHLGLIASATTFGSQTTPAAPSVAVTPLATPNEGSGGVLQAEPETFDQGQQGSQCLLGPCPNGPTPSGSGSSAYPNRAWLAVVGVGASATLVAALVTVDRRRQIPPAPKVPGTRYPPQSIPVGDISRATGRPKVDPLEPRDPLENLW